MGTCAANYCLKNCFIFGAKYHRRNITAAVANTAMARSGLVRKVTLATAKSDKATSTFNKAKNQLMETIINF